MVGRVPLSNPDICRSVSMLLQVRNQSVTFRSVCKSVLRLASSVLALLWISLEATTSSSGKTWRGNLTSVRGGGHEGYVDE